MPGSVARVLNATHVQHAWREKKRKLESGEDIEERQGKGKKRRIDETVVLKRKSIASIPPIDEDEGEWMNVPGSFFAILISGS